MNPYEINYDELPSTLSQQTSMGFILALVLLTAAGVLAVEWFVRLQPGRRRMAVVAVAAALGVYLYGYVWLTILCREPKPDQTYCLIPFESYRYAFDGLRVEHLSTWRQIILNYLLYIPPGLLLPCLLRLCGASHPWRKSALTALCLTVLNELAQFLTKRGMCEADDLINNMLGFGVGLGIYAVLCRLLNLRAKQNGG